tara:strand:- start:574 stop:849 length:276 start_codon:yes stop_codon:yes gene_type:complete
MGKLSEGQAKDLLDKGVIDKSTYNKMQNDGIISAGRGIKRRYIQTADGNYVSPMLYFSGLKGAKYSDDMKKLKTEVNQVIERFTTTTMENK